MEPEDVDAAELRRSCTSTSLYPLENACPLRGVRFAAAASLEAPRVRDWPKGLSAQKFFLTSRYVAALEHLALNPRLLPVNAGTQTTGDSFFATRTASWSFI